ncbi:hypothetical protein BG006_009360 [Podila minutissima]|uniref:Poly [ADP-ribose] polymerase n=1 Tax=Podila minutissima TaxID=64525 RepID=A0A9P5SH77_9FUNG|nr:hypothetical protein BG006_009360 [Podila minutissima]
MARAPSNHHDLRLFIREVHLVETQSAANTTPTKKRTPRCTLLQSLVIDANDDSNHDGDDEKDQDEGHSASDKGQYDDDDDERQEDDALCSILSGLSTHPKTEAEAHVTHVRRLDPHRDQVTFKRAVDHFHANWTKNNATQVTVESVLEVTSNQHAKFEAYKATIASRKPGYEAERTLYHGTYSCQGKYHYDLQDGATNHKVLQQLCYKNDCATCGILAHGFDLSRSGQGSLVRGQDRIWQRFGHGIYFSPNSSKCHFYSKTGNTGYHPTTKKNFGTMVVAKVVLGSPHHPQRAGKAEEAWTVPPGGHDSVVSRAGDGIVAYEENVVYTPAACLPTAVITYSFTSTTEYN